MRPPNLFETAWTEAEQFCAQKISEMTGLERGLNLFLLPEKPDVADCANFQITSPKDGRAVTLDDCDLFPFSATLDFWFFDATQIQTLIMRVVRDLCRLDLEESNVQQFNFDAQNGVSPITRTSMYVKSQDKVMDLCTARLSFVVVFYAGGRE